MSKTSRRRKREGGPHLSEMRLRVMAEYGSSGIWVIEQVGPFRHGMISHVSLGLPQELARRFDQWINDYDARLADMVPEYAHMEFDAEEFNRIGRALARELKTLTGPEGYVEFLPELQDGGMGDAEVME